MADLTVGFRCPCCGERWFSAELVESQSTPYDELLGTPCRECGEPLTDEAVKREALGVVAKKIAEIKKTLRL